MLEIFKYSFMLRALEAGIIISILAPIIGIFLVSRRLSLISDTLSHVSLAGVAIGLLLGIYPVATAIVVSILAGILIEKLRGDKNISSESTLAMFLSGGLAIAVVLISLAKGFNTDLFSYLFGSITTVTVSDLWTILILGVIILVTISLFYKDFLYIAFDEDGARVAGLPVKFLNILYIVLTATTVSLSMRIVGVLLIGALMVIPVVSAIQLKLSFKNTLFVSILISFVSVIIGLFASYFLNLAAGGTIVVVSLIIFGIITLLKK
ncbi:metal ABC transporter permease [Candidatus Woesebacteria bacterium]|nr:metal ABC transporter permease [Candidatus Woesebacteria bacterium]QQG47962.1 MAG: metal ABC transporter permease [Candidatus Woesebacteria bacterium]